MWPFTSRRIFGNRWWAIAFVVFVCWQAVEMVDGQDATTNNAADAQYAHDMANSLNSF